ncbi:MAG TPA: PQQ-binding-like beta-propeller repeat protein [Vicinamibacterales bacterium]|nr:PQQ-binding-like beta-propeller repeat protein [Vicinamibacterales bacterium]
MRTLVPSTVLALLIISTVPASVPPEAWPGFRGPNTDGLAADAKLPTSWTTIDNVAWAVDVPGRGWSSPIVWGETVYVTSAISSGAFKQPSPGIYGNDYIAELRAQGVSDDEIMKRVRARDNEFPSESDAIRYMVYAFDAKTGARRWERESHKGLPFGGRHRKNTYASETPITDGERLYAYFGQNVGLFAYTLDGQPLWSRTWTPQPIYLDFGTASSPALHNGRLYLVQDSQEMSYLTIVDAKTGDEIVRREREPSPSIMKSSWSTPFVWKHTERTEIITVGQGLVISYDLDGNELWRSRGLGHSSPTPLASGGLLYVGTGAQSGDARRPFFAIRPGASGDITLAEDATSNAHIAWVHPRASGYTPSPIIHDGRAYLVHDTGILTVLRAETGEEIYRARLGGVGHTFSASPIAAGNRLYFPDEEGVTIVIEAGDEYREVAQNDLGELLFASPAVQGHAMFVRTESKLYRIEGK